MVTLRKVFQRKQDIVLLVRAFRHSSGQAKVENITLRIIINS